MRTRAIAALIAILASFVALLATTDTEAQPTAVAQETTTTTWREGDVRFKVTCNYSHTLPDDPIVFPNQPGASHLHDFTGFTDTDAGTIWYSQLLAYGSSTTCNNPGDHAAYWTPALRVNGDWVAPTRATVYYRRGLKQGTINPYPPALKMVAHGGTTGWMCNGSNQVRSSPSGCTVDLTMRVEFPDCWNGGTLDSPDHMSHMAYADNGVCPGTHQVMVPEATMTVHFDDAVLDGTDEIVTSAGLMGHPHPVHGDLFNGWTMEEMQDETDRCLNGYLRCDSGG